MTIVRIISGSPSILNAIHIKAFMESYIVVSTALLLIALSLSFSSLSLVLQYQGE